MRGDPSGKSERYHRTMNAISIESLNDKTKNCDGQGRLHETNGAVARDGGWGWVIVAGFFVMQLLITGFTFSFGVMYVELREEFNSSAAMTSLSGSINTGIQYFISPISTALSSRYSVRITVLIGSLLIGLATVACAFSPNIYFFTIAYSVCGGIGAAFTYSPGTILVNQYFDRFRGIANGICNSGSSFGVFIFPPLMNALFHWYGFMGTFMIIGALLLNNCAIAMTFRTPHQVKGQGNIVITLCEGERNVQSVDIVNIDKEITAVTNETKAASDDILLEKSNDVNASKYTKEQMTNEVSGNRWWELIGVHHFKDLTFMCYCCALTLGMIAFISCLQLLVDYGKDLGIAEGKAVFLLSAIGMVDGIGRIVIGAILDISQLKSIRKFICLGMLCSAGIFTMIVAFVNDYVGLAITSTLLGSLHGLFCSQRAILIIDLFGLDNLSSCFGLVMAFSGVGILFGPAFPAWLKDFTGKYRWSFTFNGTSTLLGGMLLLAVCIRRI